ncbi:hypothetical protein FJY71_03110 [candidate division WOR-3 bacterium]|nr:hypothetical protein [candidate division WOR-3 bacterium]
MVARIASALALVAALAPGQTAKEPPVVPYDSLMEDRVSVDATVDTEENEYPASFIDRATGITVHWGFDDSCLYVALTGRGQGWLAIGFGSPRMHESNMVIGYYSDDSAGVVNHLGQEYVHAATADSNPLLEEYDIDYDDETGQVTLEFVYPLKWPGLRGAAVSALEPNDTYDMILARNARTVSLAQPHGQRAQLRFRLAENPKLAGQPEGGR